MNKQQAFELGVLVGGQHTRTEYVDRNIDITVNRAPTDESVALLKEMEEAAREKILASIPMEGNSFHGELIIDRDAVYDCTRLTLVAVINGTRITVTEKTRAESAGDMLEVLRDAVAKRIATELLGPAFSAMRAKLMWPK